MIEIEPELQKSFLSATFRLKIIGVSLVCAGILFLIPFIFIVSEQSKSPSDVGPVETANTRMESGSMPIDSGGQRQELLIYGGTCLTLGIIAIRSSAKWRRAAFSSTDIRQACHVATNDIAKALGTCALVAIVLIVWFILFGLMAFGVATGLI